MPAESRMFYQEVKSRALAAEMLCVPCFFFLQQRNVEFLQQEASQVVKA